jgi:hypothetical protein
VLALSLGASALYSLLSLIGKLTAPKGLAGSSTTINQSVSERAWLDASYQVLDVLLGVAPVALVFYLGWRSYGGAVVDRFGLTSGAKLWPRQLGRGVLLAAAIGVPGLGLYLASRALGLSAKVIPTDQHPQWWSLALLLLFAAKAAALEEVIAVGYLFDRLAVLGVSARWIVVGSALLRGSYHLYQGFGGFIGNVAMGLVFGWLFLRLQRRGSGALWPLVIAHFAIDATVFVGYSLIDLSSILN